jgi:ferrous iron transport protein B
MEIRPRTGPALPWRDGTPTDIETTQRTVNELLVKIGWREPLQQLAALLADSVLMHPIFGLVLLGVLLFFVFQAVFSFAKLPMNLIQGGVTAAGSWIAHVMPPGPLQSLLVEGIVSGVGSVLVFLPQIIILFAFILALEDSGYLPRAAFLLDRVMGSVGLSGRAFIPLLSSFACAIPGIMATRTIETPKDRLATILVAPLMSCSAR